MIPAFGLPSLKDGTVYNNLFNSEQRVSPLGFFFNVIWCGFALWWILCYPRWRAISVSGGKSSMLWLRCIFIQMYDSAARWWLVRYVRIPGVVLLILSFQVGIAIVARYVVASSLVDCIVKLDNLCSLNRKTALRPNLGIFSIWYWGEELTPGQWPRYSSLSLQASPPKLMIFYINLLNSPHGL